MSLFSRGYRARDRHFEEPVHDTVDEEVCLPVQPQITLDSQQEVIVNSTENNIIVVAGAGSGKTRVLTERIRHLIEDVHVPPHNIVAITFTNMASEEMKLRLKDVDGIGDCFIGTIHSFANRIMKESGEKYTLFNDELDNKLHKELIEKYCEHLTNDKYLEYKDIRSLVDAGKIHQSVLDSFFLPSERAEFNTLHASKEAVEADKDSEIHLTFGESIETLCEKRGIITFDELLVKAKTYFENLGATIEYVFVDEFQDVGPLEYNFIRALNAQNYFFVGDDYQSIYGFKGGNVNLFLALVKGEDFTTYYLTNNYRNSKDIIMLAEKVISQVDNKITKETIPMSNKSGSFKILHKNNLRSVMTQLQDSEMNDFKDWFFLTRTNKEIYDVINVCNDLGIPYTTFKREGMSLADVNKQMASRKLKILTVHTAKGLEIDNVILYGNFPVIQPLYIRNEDERKVMYVGVTRAKNQIIILN